MDETLTATVADWAGCEVATTVELDGGEVGTVHRVDLADGRRVAVKTAGVDLTVEAGMLRHLAGAGLAVPAVLDAGADHLVLEYVPGDGAVTPAVERDLAERLAALHATEPPDDAPGAAFGFPVETLTGAYRQPNPWTADWPAFFGDHRLDHAAGAAHAEGALPGDLRDRVDRLVADLPALLDHDPSPGLIHGDVWRENLVVDGDGVRAFLDPACYYADPEVELAYVDWTGLGGDAFFERYDAVAGLADGFDQRAAVYRCYPLLTHVRHFGEDYLDPLAATLAGLGY